MRETAPVGVNLSVCQVGYELNYNTYIDAHISCPSNCLLKLRGPKKCTHVLKMSSLCQYSSLQANSKDISHFYVIVNLISDHF